MVRPRSAAVPAQQPGQGAGGRRLGGLGRAGGAAEDRLTALEATAGVDELRGRAAQLRDAVRAATADVTALVSGGPDDTFPSELDAVIAALEGALRPETGAHAH